MPRVNKPPMLRMHQHNVEAILASKMICTLRRDRFDGTYRLAESGWLIDCKTQPGPPFKWSELTLERQTEIAHWQGHDTVAEFIAANKRVRGAKQIFDGKVDVYLIMLSGARYGS